MPRIPPKPLPLLSRREERLNDLITFVHNCQACPTMDGRRRVLSNKNGTVGVKVMFVGEAPGRNGADRTGIPFHGDPAGNTFERLLDAIGWSRDDVFVTNAVLCNPRTTEGNNRTPIEREMRNCSFNLKSTIDVVQPGVIAALGNVPLAALSLIEPHQATLRESVGKPIPWYDRVLFPLYHTSPRAMLHRSFDRMVTDFETLKAAANAVAPWCVPFPTEGE